jgi:hypothetical protein
MLLHNIKSYHLIEEKLCMLRFDGWQLIAVRFLRSTLVVCQSITLKIQARFLAKMSERAIQPFIIFFRSTYLAYAFSSKAAQNSFGSLIF